MEMDMQCAKCGMKFEPKPWQVSSHDYRCLPCKRVQQNKTNEAKGEKLKEEAKDAYQRRKEYYADYWQRQRSDPDHLKKRAARRKVATEIEAGRLARQPCRSCGAEKADAHHHDYDKPLEIDWLCRRCHFKEDGHGAKKHV